jgi:hypothetical protein
MTIHAITCEPQGTALPGDSNNCGGGGTVRTNGTQNYPCQVRSRTVLDTYVCPIHIPSGASITAIQAYGWDFDTTGYFEAAAWYVFSGTFAVTYLSSSLGGTWQNSGVAFSGGQANFPILKSTDTPVLVDGTRRYVIGFATISPGGAGNVQVEGFQVSYTVP